MKIAFIHTYYREKGGEDAVVFNEMSLLKNAGHTVELLKFENPSSSLKAIFNLLLMPFNVFSFFKTLKHLRRFQPDIVHIHNWHFTASPAVIVACQLLKIPTVLTLHNFRLLCPSATLFYEGQLYLQSIPAKFPWDAVRKGVYRNSSLQTFCLAFTVFLHKKIGTWKKVNTYIVFSEFAKNIFAQSKLGIPEDRFAIKVNAIAEPIFEQEVKRENFFLFIGRLVPEKGVDVLLDAFAKTDLPLLMYGAGPLEQKVKAFADTHQNISYCGAIPQQEVYENMRRCSMLVFPSIWYEGMPITLVEALATGTPVLASNLGAMSTMVTDRFNGLHFEAGNSADLAVKLEYWSQLPVEEKNQYTQNARTDFVEKYTLAANQERLESIYEQAKTSI
jgi:glycosyltransferase involved in cell wall biosynthesis